MLNGKSENFVAKRFYQIGGGQDHVSIADNARLLASEAQRLYIGKYFLDKFYEYAHEAGVEVAEGTSSYTLTHPRSFD